MISGVNHWVAVPFVFIFSIIIYHRWGDALERLFFTRTKEKLSIVSIIGKGVG